MQIDWIHFTPFASLAGGITIGIAAALFLLVGGRILGVSGILGGLLESGERGWRLSFILGLAVAPVILKLFVALPAPDFAGGWIPLLVAGLLVGFGTRMGSGCTSGHGVCGLARLSPRSLAATLSFMLGGFVTVFVIRHLSGGGS